MTGSDVINPPIPTTEAQRLRALEKYRLGGLGREAAFDHITQLATRLFDVPMALVSIVGSDQQCFRGACGIEASSTPRDVAFCAFAILQKEVMVVPDALEDPRFRGNPLVTGAPHVRFYAGAPLVVDGEAVGTLCLIDEKPRLFSADDAARLADLARTVVDLIELRVERFVAEEQRQQLAAQRELLKLTVDNVSEGVALFDGDLRLILWNDEFTNLFGYAPETMVEGASAADLIHQVAVRGELGPGDPRQIVAALAETIRSTPSRRLEIQRADGRVLDVRRRTISGGRFISTARDIGDERRIARFKDELVSTVSHELRTPLTAISGAIGLMAGGAAGELPLKARQLVTVAQKNVDRLTRLVNDLLDIDKLQSGRLVFHFAEHDVGALLADAVDQNQPFAERFGIRLSLDLPDRPVIACIDADRIVQVVTNLISNGAKFSPPGGTVAIALAAESDHVRVTVSDEGPGMSREFQRHLFGRFAQEDGAHQKGHSGTGLGLAISKAIVDHHGGEIQVESDLGKGTSFHVLLPIARTHPEEAKAA